MSSEGASVKSAILITIIGESVLGDRLIKMLKSKGVSGYTISEARGEGGHGKRMGDIAGYRTNIEIKTVVPADVSDDIFHAIAEMRSEHALIAFRHEVEALA